MSSLPEPLLELVAVLNKLPGIGPRSAERIALHLVQSDAALATRLAEAVRDSRERIRHCGTCGGLTQADPCRICSDSHRDTSLLCIVERAVDVFTIEKAGSFRGQYHVLGGRISPTNAVGPEDLRIAELEKRLGSGIVKEVVLALGSDVEGDATSFYLAKRLGSADVRVTRIAHGLPAGAGLDFADEITLTRALEGRRAID
jgi:recombination protein RecR